MWGYKTDNARVPIGTDGFLATADSNLAAGWGWEQGPGAQPNFVAPYIILNAGLGAAYGPVMVLTPPPLLSGFTWVNQGTATVTQASGGAIYEKAPSGGSNLRAMVKTAPATPYTLTALLAPTAGGNNVRSGLCWYDSGSGKFATFSFWAQASGDPGFEYAAWTNSTSFSSNSSNGFTSGPCTIGGPCFMRLADDGTNRTVSISADGVSFIQLATNGHTQFLTPDSIGFFAYGDSAGGGAAQALLSWLTA